MKSANTHTHTHAPPYTHSPLHSFNPLPPNTHTHSHTCFWVNTSSLSLSRIFSLTRRGHANILCVVAILILRRGSNEIDSVRRNKEAHRGVGAKTCGRQQQEEAQMRDCRVGEGVKFHEIEVQRSSQLLKPSTSRNENNDLLLHLLVRRRHRPHNKYVNEKAVVQL